MSNPIPQEIKTKVLVQWLQGISRDKIASLNDIGSGTVSDIILRMKSDDCDIDLMRHTALTMKMEGISISDLASSIRLNKILKQYCTAEEDVEEILKDIDIHCFKKDKDKKEFVNEIQNISYLAADFKVPIEDLPLHFQLLRKKLNSMESEVITKEHQVSQTLKNYNITLKDIQEYRSKRPLFNQVTYLEKTVIQTKRELTLALKDIDGLVEENERSKEENERSNLKIKFLSNREELK